MAIAQKVRIKPQISINKLAEYIEASLPQQKAIVYNAKFPNDVIPLYYKEAREHTVRFLEGKIDTEELESIIEDFKVKKNNPNLTSKQKAKIKNNIIALESLLETDLSNLRKFEISRRKGKNIPILIKGVRVSVYPDLILTKEIKGKKYTGALKVHIAKGELKNEGMKIIGGMLHYYMENYHPVKDKPVNVKLCMSFDVFKQSFEKSPNSFKLGFRSVEVACESIANWWDKLDVTSK